MQRKNQPKPMDEKRPKRAPVALDRRYGEIGISAVAAAVRYKSETKSEAEPKKEFALALDRD
ncbi:MAG: hypothetical protein C5B56_14940 [Proteobacteria bacterium]|nr:MAG: hypothetical protein C5B56_14940 [Pseudomonadota bacterium]